MSENTLNAKSLKATLVLDASEIAKLPTPPNGVPRTTLRISVAGRIVTADLNSKSVRKALLTIQEAKPENVACILQGRLAGDDTLLDAGLSALPKTKAEAPAKQDANVGARE
jgi:hypothetical protein